MENNKLNTAIGKEQPYSVKELISDIGELIYNKMNAFNSEIGSIYYIDSPEDNEKKLSGKIESIHITRTDASIHKNRDIFKVEVIFIKE